MASFDYYEILEIKQTADEAEIKKAYRKMALKWHPDKNPDKKDEAEARFKEISEAYEVLSDKDKRQIYNIHGKEGLAEAASGSQQDDDDEVIFVSTGRRHRHRGHANSFFRFAFRDPMDIFQEVFGGSDPFADLFPTPSFSLFGGDIFGGADPFFGGMQSIFSSFQQQEAPGCSRRNRVNNSTRTTRLQPYNANHHHHHPPSANSLDSIFNSGISLFGGFPGMSMNIFNGGGSSGGGGSFRSSSTSTKVVNGRTIVTKKVVENGSETVTVECNGQVESKTVNGRRIV